RGASYDAGDGWPPALRSVALAPALARVRPGVHRGLHDRFPVHAGRMTTSPMTLPASARVASHAPPKRVFGWLFAVAILAVIGAYVRAIYFTPIEALQGAVQKIYYLHVPAWIACYLAHGLVAVGSVINLWLHDERADRLAASAAEVGI